MELADRVALIPGGSGGIGRAIAAALGREGARIALMARSEKALREAAGELRNHGVPVLALQGDVANPDDVQTVTKRTREELGSIQILVNCAATQGAIGPLWENDAEA